jgi:agmatinase
LGFGFSGAPILPQERLPEVARPGDVVFFGVDQELNRRFGHSNRGAASFIRQRTIGMLPWTQAQGRPCHDVGLIEAEGCGEALEAACQTSERIATLGCCPVLIACDHTASLAGALGVVRGQDRPVAYLYFDAHFDLGLHHPAGEVHNGNFVERLRRLEGISRIVNLGGRGWSCWAGAYAQVPGFRSIAGGERWVSVPDALARLDDLRGRELYVSIDADVLDPSIAPNVACPEPFGMRLEDLFALCSWIGASCRVLGADLCELLPTDRELGAEQALLRCAQALFPREASVEMPPG